MSVHEAEVAFLQLFEQLEIQNKPKKHRFPLLKLPRVVLLECIENLDVLEIILFSLVSKRAKTIAKLVHWTPLNVCLKTESPPEVQLQCSINPCRQWIIEFNKEKDSSEYPCFYFYQDGPIVEHFLYLKDNGNAIEDSKQMTEHICEVFRSPLSGVDLGEESQIEWIFKFKKTLRKVWIWNTAITSVETLDRILENLKATEYFWLSSIAIDKEFQYTEPIPFRSISIDSSYWLTLPSILYGTNSIIRLYDSKLTPKDINTILKEWQMGTKLQNLEYLEITTVAFQNAYSFTNDVLKDLNWTDGDENDGRPKAVKIHGEVTYTLPVIQIVKNLIRDNEMIGSIFQRFGVFENGKLKICFCFQVWSKKV